MLAKIVNGGDEGQLLLTAKNFTTGSDGYFGSDKLTLDGVRYQVQITMVRIDSKLEPEAADRARAAVAEQVAKAAAKEAAASKLHVAADVTVKTPDPQVRPANPAMPATKASK